MTPKRIQRKRTKGWRMPPNTVYVGRPSKWGNPFKVCWYRTPEQAVESFRELLKGGVYAFEFLEAGKRILEDIDELKNKNLCCWCPLDKPCHVDVYLEILYKKAR